jgi:hypothetical protein
LGKLSFNMYHEVARTQPEDFLRLAQLLRSEIDKSQGARRAIAHACYYAVYHLMAAHFQIDPRSRAGSRHGEIKDLLAGFRFVPPVPRHVVIARREYPRLMLLRARADYNLEEPFTSAQANIALRAAEEIFAAIPGASRPC